MFLKLRMLSKEGDCTSKTVPVLINIDNISFIGKLMNQSPPFIGTLIELLNGRKLAVKSKMENVERGIDTLINNQNSDYTNRGIYEVPEESNVISPD